MLRQDYDPQRHNPLMARLPDRGQRWVTIVLMVLIGGVVGWRIAEIASWSDRGSSLWASVPTLIVIVLLARYGILFRSGGRFDWLPPAPFDHPLTALLPAAVAFVAATLFDATLLRAIGAGLFVLVLFVTDVRYIRRRRA